MFDPDELVRWAETYGHPEEWAQKAKEAHAANEVLRARIDELVRDRNQVENEKQGIVGELEATDDALEVAEQRREAAEERTERAAKEQELAEKRYEDIERLLTVREQSTYGQAAELLRKWLADGPEAGPLERLESDTRDWLGGAE